MVNFPISCPFKGTWAGSVCLLWFDSSFAHWVNAEWDSPSTESMRSETSSQLSQHGVRFHVNWVNAEDNNIYEDFIILRWLSWHWLSLRVDSVDVESHLALTQLTRDETRCQLSHHRMLEIQISKFKYKIKNTEKPYNLAYICLISTKKRNKKILCKCTFNTYSPLPPLWQSIVLCLFVSVS